MQFHAHFYLKNAYMEMFFRYNCEYQVFREDLVIVLLKKSIPIIGFKTAKNVHVYADMGGVLG